MLNKLKKHKIIPDIFKDVESKDIKLLVYFGDIFKGETTNKINGDYMDLYKVQSQPQFPLNLHTTTIMFDPNEKYLHYLFTTIKISDIKHIKKYGAIEDQFIPFEPLEKADRMCIIAQFKHDGKNFENIDRYVERENFSISQFMKDNNFNIPFAVNFYITK